MSDFIEYCKENSSLVNWKEKRAFNFFNSSLFLDVLERQTLDSQKTKSEHLFSEHNFVI